MYTENDNLDYMQIYTFLFYPEFFLRSIEFLAFGKNIYNFSRKFHSFNVTRASFPLLSVKSIVPVA